MTVIEDGCFLGEYEEQLMEINEVNKESLGTKGIWILKEIIADVKLKSHYFLRK